MAGADPTAETLAIAERTIWMGSVLTRSVQVPLQVLLVHLDRAATDL